MALGRYLGVTYDPRRSVGTRYRVVVNHRNTRHRIGRFETLKQAVQARNDFIDENKLPHTKQRYKP